MIQIINLRQACGLLMIAALVALAGCATPGGYSSSGNPHYKVGRPYQIGGRWYYPKADASYDAVGVASWYGRQFQGKPTANGEIFDKERLSAAHKTLPLPSLVEVQNLENGRTIVVRVNDRGPFVDDREIDLSRAAAEALGFEQKGLAKVRVRYVGPADLYAKSTPRGRRAQTHRRTTIAKAPTSPARRATLPTVAAVDEDAIATLIGEALTTAPNYSAEYWIAVSDFTDLNQLETARQALSAGGETRIVTNPAGQGAFTYQLQLGPEFDPVSAEERLAALREAGYPSARIVADTL